MFALQSTSCMTGASDEAGEHTALLEQQHITDTDTADTQNVLRREHAGLRSVLVFSLAFFLAFTAWHPLQVSLNNLPRMQHRPHVETAVSRTSNRLFFMEAGLLQYLARSVHQEISSLNQLYLTYPE